MKMKATLSLILISAFALVSGCTSMHDVMPKQSLTMEQIYDDTGKAHAQHETDKNDDSLAQVRKEVSPIKGASTSLSEEVLPKNTWQVFHKVQNPTLKLYVYPHLAGNDELPVPGYMTAFNAYERDHYSLLTD
jgi:conjugative transfer region lipoprotein (TIGR03751 family)